MKDTTKFITLFTDTILFGIAVFMCILFYSLKINQNDAVFETLNLSFTIKLMMELLYILLLLYFFSGRKVNPQGWLLGFFSFAIARTLISTVVGVAFYFIWQQVNQPQTWNFAFSDAFIKYTPTWIIQMLMAPWLAYPFLTTFFPDILSPTQEFSSPEIVLSAKPEPLPNEAFITPGELDRMLNENPLPPIIERSHIKYQPRKKPPVKLNQTAVKVPPSVTQFLSKEELPVAPKREIPIRQERSEIDVFDIKDILPVDIEELATDFDEPVPYRDENSFYKDNSTSYTEQILSEGDSLIPDIQEAKETSQEPRQRFERKPVSDGRDASLNINDIIENNVSMRAGTILKNVLKDGADFDVPFSVEMLLNMLESGKTTVRLDYIYNHAPIEALDFTKTITDPHIKGLELRIPFSKLLKQMNTPEEQNQNALSEWAVASSILASNQLFTEIKEVSNSPAEPLKTINSLSDIPDELFSEYPDNNAEPAASNPAGDHFGNSQNESGLLESGLFEQIDEDDDEPPMSALDKTHQPEKTDFDEINREAIRESLIGENIILKTPTEPYMAPEMDEADEKSREFPADSDTAPEMHETSDFKIPSNIEGLDDIFGESEPDQENIAGKLLGNNMDLASGILTKLEESDNSTDPSKTPIESSSEPVETDTHEPDHTEPAESEDIDNLSLDSIQELSIDDLFAEEPLNEVISEKQSETASEFEATEPFEDLPEGDCFEKPPVYDEPSADTIQKDSIDDRFVAVDDFCDEDSLKDDDEIAAAETLDYIGNNAAAEERLDKGLIETNDDDVMDIADDFDELPVLELDEAEQDVTPSSDDPEKGTFDDSEISADTHKDSPKSTEAVEINMNDFLSDDNENDKADINMDITDTFNLNDEGIAKPDISINTSDALLKKLEQEDSPDVSQDDADIPDIEIEKTDIINLREIIRQEIDEDLDSESTDTVSADYGSAENSDTDDVKRMNPDHIHSIDSEFSELLSDENEQQPDDAEETPPPLIEGYGQYGEPLDVIDEDTAIEKQDSESHKADNLADDHLQKDAFPMLIGSESPIEIDSVEDELKKMFGAATEILDEQQRIREDEGIEIPEETESRDDAPNSPDAKEIELASATSTEEIINDQASDSEDLMDIDIEDLIDEDTVSSMDEIQKETDLQAQSEKLPTETDTISGTDVSNLDVLDFDVSSIDDDIFDVLPERAETSTAMIAAELTDESEDQSEQTDGTSSIAEEEIDIPDLNDMSPLEEEITKMVSSLNFQMEPTPEFSKQNQGVETDLDVFADLQRESFNLFVPSAYQSAHAAAEEVGSLNIDMYKDVKNYLTDTNRPDSDEMVSGPKAEDDESGLFLDGDIVKKGNLSTKPEGYLLETPLVKQSITRAPDLDISDIADLEEIAADDDTTQFEAPEIGFDLDDDIMSQMAEQTANEMDIFKTKGNVPSIDLGEYAEVDARQHILSTADKRKTTKPPKDEITINTPFELREQTDTGLILDNLIKIKARDNSEPTPSRPEQEHADYPDLRETDLTYINKDIIENFIKTETFKELREDTPDYSIWASHVADEEDIFSEADALEERPVIYSEYNGGDLDKIAMRIASGEAPTSLSDSLELPDIQEDLFDDATLFIEDINLYTERTVDKKKQVPENDSDIIVIDPNDTIRLDENILKRDSLESSISPEELITTRILKSEEFRDLVSVPKDSRLPEIMDDDSRIRLRPFMKEDNGRYDEIFGDNFTEQFTIQKRHEQLLGRLNDIEPDTPASEIPTLDNSEPDNYSDDSNDLSLKDTPIPTAHTPEPLAKSESPTSQPMQETLNFSLPQKLLRELSYTKYIGRDFKGLIVGDGENDMVSVFSGLPDKAVIRMINSIPDIPLNGLTGVLSITDNRHIGLKFGIWTGAPLLLLSQCENVISGQVYEEISTLFDSETTVSTNRPSRQPAKPQKKGHLEMKKLGITGNTYLLSDRTYDIYAGDKLPEATEHEVLLTVDFMVSCLEVYAEETGASSDFEMIIIRTVSFIALCVKGRKGNTVLVDRFGTPIGKLKWQLKRLS